MNVKHIMRFWKRLMLMGGIGLSTMLLYGQSGPLSNLKTRTLISSQPETLTLDSLYILPATLSIQDKEGQPLDPKQYRMEGYRLRWIDPPEEEYFPVRLSYRVLPFRLDQKVAHLDSSLFNRRDQSELMVWRGPGTNVEEWLELGAVNSSGSFARSLSFGNNQDLVLNSRFNMQIAGQLGNDVQLTAAITDENIPIQPEGNTQNLREFDRIFVQLEKENSSLTAGDYELNRPDSYFINYLKKLQGISVRNATQLNKQFTLRSDASLAVARGKFARNLLDQQEGNQGPYQLRGAENERFIVILSGTERVWLDGRLLTRGIDHDYIIDYNRGEITFTNQNLITKDSRIIVEFDYTDQQYLRSLVAFNTALESEKLDIRFNMITQQDSKNPSRTSRLTEAEKLALQQAGDQLNQTLSQAVDTLRDLSSTQVSYYYRDTVVQCSGRDSVYAVLLLNQNPEVITPLLVQFSFVGEGNGHYEIDNTKAANERVFRWIAPDPQTCSPRGSYAPTRPLIAPKQEAMAALSTRWRMNSNNQLNLEFSWSQEDLNRFSSLDKEDDLGYAMFASWQSKLPLGKDEKDWILANNLQYEFMHQHFKPLSPYRTPEFQRDWNLVGKQNEGSVLPASEHLLSSELSLTKARLAHFNFNFGFFNRADSYQGFRQTFDAGLDNDSWDVKASASWVNATTAEEKRSFFRPKLSLIRTISPKSPWQLGFYTEIESNSRQADQQDTLNDASFKYDLLKVFLQSNEQAENQFQFSLSQRKDYQPDGETFGLQTLAREANVKGQLKVNRHFSINGNLTYRKLEIEDATDLNVRAGDTYLGRMDNRLAFAKGAIRSNTTYELGSGQEPRREFTFIRVIRGEGTHIWLDSLYNNDGIIQPNEMEIAPFQDQADFVKVATFSNEFIRTNYVNLNQSFQITPKAVWFNKKGIKKFLSLFALQSYVKISRRTQQGAQIDLWNPFQLEVADTSLIALSSGIRNLLFFNRGNPDFDLQLGQIDNRSKFLQTTGFESKSRHELFLTGRVNFNQTLGVETNVSSGENETLSQLAANRNFTLRFFELKNQLNYFINTSLRFSAGYQLTSNKNTKAVSEPARATTHEFKLEGHYAQSTKMFVRLDASFVQVDFEGNPNSPVGFAILNGLQRGRNFLWRLNLDRQLSSSLRLSLGYEGRKTGQARVIHVGRAQIAALF